MTSSNDNLESLFAKARLQTPPHVDVTARVVESIHKSQRAPKSDRSALAIAAAAIAAASVAIAVAWQSREELQNPLVEIYRPPVYSTQ